MNYEEQTRYDESKATTSNRTRGPTLHIEYLKSRAGILKIIEILLSLLTFICSLIYAWEGHGWALFVSISAFVSTLTYLIFHVVNLISRFPGPWLLIEFIYYLVFSVFFLITAILAAAHAGIGPSIAATAVFAFSATAVYVVDTVFQFRAWHGGEASIATSRTVTTTTSGPITLDRGRPQY